MMQTAEALREASWGAEDMVGLGIITVTWVPLALIQMGNTVLPRPPETCGGIQ